MRQTRRIAERLAHFIPRPAVIKALDERIRSVAGGLITLEGAPGSGTTSLFCHLAAARPYAFWLPEDDDGAGIEALCAQLLALHDLAVPLVPPAAARDATTLERLLADVGAARPSDDPLVVLIGRLPDPDAVATPPPFPTAIPPGVVVILACSPNSPLPIQPAARVAMPTRGATLERRLTRAAAQLGCAPEAAAAIAARSRGAFLYVRLAVGLLSAGLLAPDALPEGLEEIHQVWWDQLDDSSHTLAALLAAAGEPLEPVLLAELATIEVERVQRQLQQWQSFLEVIDGRVQLYHASTRSFISRRSSDSLASAHARYVKLAHERSGGQLERLSTDTDTYLLRQLSRHVALSDAATRAAVGPRLASRSWTAAQERHTGTVRAGSRDAAWELRMAAVDGPALRIVRSAALCGTLTLLSRSLPHDAGAEAFAAALNRGGSREGALKRVREMLDQLPDGRDKAQALRRLGEVCYALRMRAPAMRMLSEALDLEVQGLPRPWRDQREETLVAFARAAIAADRPQTALGITARIGHAERRGMIETEVVRWLLARGQGTRAEEVAYAIGHEGMHEWAMAEVAVGHARAGDLGRAEVVLSTLKTETAVAWARAELACDAAQRGDPGAVSQMATLRSASLRDRALAQVAQALVAGAQPAAALEAARTIADREVRARALIDLALQPSSIMHTALAYAAADIIAITGEERASLVAALAAAQAAAGRLETGLNTAALLPAGEERDRAQSRVAVALARRGDLQSARSIVAAIADDDERDWGLDELARLIAGTSAWDEAFGLAGQIGDVAQRAHTEADLCIAYARAGAVLEAQLRAEKLAVPAERLRAHIAIVGPLVASGAAAKAVEMLGQLQEWDVRSRYQAALAAAFAAHAELASAQKLARAIVRPFERARALVAVARSATQRAPSQTQQILGQALLATAALGRSEVFTCLEWAADTLAALGGPELLLGAAGALDEIDTWWS